MELILERIAKRKSYTIGKLSSLTPSPSPEEAHGHGTDDQGQTTPSLPTERGQGEEVFFCDTLEPTWRDYAHGGRKIAGHSAIPEGRYPVVITWSPKFQKWLPLLLHVPNFDGIRIHAGNTAADTAGCILVGRNLKPGQVLDSNIWLHRLKKLIVEAKDRGEGVWITIR